VRTVVLTAALALALGAALPASAIEVVENQAVSTSLSRHPDLAVTPYATTLSSEELSELPEPEVFAMMLLGLVLLGYRASRDNNEKFK
jgi:hypothetical protein